MFLPVNVARDVQAAWVREGLTPFGKEYWSGIKSAILKDETFSEAARSGAFMSGIVENMRNVGKAVDVGRLTQGALEVKSAKDALLLIPRLLEQANLAAERGTRIAIYSKGRAAGLDELTSAIKARDATVDFSKSGHSMRVLNQIIPFANAAAQGTANMVRTAKQNPKALAIFGGVFSTPTIMARINNMRFDTSEDIPDYEYTRSWVVQTGEGTRSDGSKFPIYIKIPKGEYAALLTFPAEVMFGIARETENRSAVEMVLRGAMEQSLNISPIDPNVVSSLPGVSTAVGFATNTDLFTGAPIVPSRERGLLPEQQFGPETSSTAIALGPLASRFNINPRLIDFAIRDVTASAGAAANWLSGFGLEALGWTRPMPYGAAVSGDPAKTGIEAAASIPGVGRFVNVKATQQERTGWDNFDKAETETNRAFSDIPGMDALGVRLGKAPSSLNIAPNIQIDVTPQQQAKIQRELGKMVTPVLREYAATLTGTVEQKRTAISAELSNLKADVLDRMVLDLALPEDKAQAAALTFRKRLAATGYENVVLDHPIIQASPEMAALYTRWKRTGNKANLAADDPLSNPARQAVMRRIDRETSDKEKQLRMDNVDIDLGLVRYYGQAGVTPQGKALRKALDQQKARGG